jgi:hypothetical protein
VSLVEYESLYHTGNVVFPFVVDTMLLVAILVAVLAESYSVIPQIASLSPSSSFFFFGGTRYTGLPLATFRL